MSLVILKTDSEDDVKTVFDLSYNAILMSPWHNGEIIKNKMSVIKGRVVYDASEMAN